jgi:hypothetical protein
LTTHFIDGIHIDSLLNEALSVPDQLSAAGMLDEDSSESLSSPAINSAGVMNRVTFDKFGVRLNWYRIRNTDAVKQQQDFIIHVHS